jgi:hypothetical protein
VIAGVEGSDSYATVMARMDRFKGRNDYVDSYSPSVGVENQLNYLTKRANHWVSPTGLWELME